MQFKIVNAKVITPYRILSPGTVYVSDDKITAVTEGSVETPNIMEIDAGGRYVAPGFIDLHVHGGGGYSFMDGTVEAFLEVAKLHARYGTTALSPTTLTSERSELMEILDCYETASKKNVQGAAFIGMHLEGPYIALSQAGAQDSRFIRNPDPDEYEEVLCRPGVVSRWSAAPELKGALAFGRYLRSRGVIAAVCHTDAIYEELVEAFENGYTLATHFYSAMSGVTRRNAYRYAGVIEGGYLIDEMDVEIIADGVHLPAPLLKLIYAAKGPGRIALITDAMRAAGMPEGKSVLGSRRNGFPVIVEDGVAKLPDRSGFAGSVATTDRLVRTMVEIAEVPLSEAVRMMTTTPARIMGIGDRKGSLVAGKDADIVIFDEHIHIWKTIVGGRTVYDQPDNT